MDEVHSHNKEKVFFFTFKSPEIPGMHWIKLGRMKGSSPVVLNTAPLDWEFGTLTQGLALKKQKMGMIYTIAKPLGSISKLQHKW